MTDEKKYGLLPEPVKGTPPPPKPRGRKASALDRIAEIANREPGEWFKIGVFRSAQAPRKEYANHGLLVRHVKNDEGDFERWVSAAVQPDASVTPIHREA